jgi:hypothetical protein
MVVRCQFKERRLIVFDKILTGPGRRIATVSQFNQGIDPQAHGGVKGFPVNVFYPHLDHLVGIMALFHPYHNGKMRVMLSDLFNEIEIGKCISDGNDEDPSLLRPGRLEDVEAGGVAVKSLEPHFPQQVNAIRIVVEDGRRDPACPEEPPDGAPEISEPGDNDRMLDVDDVRLSCFTFPGSKPGKDEPFIDEHQQRRYGHAEGRDGHHFVRQAVRQDMKLMHERKKDKGELPYLGQAQGKDKILIELNLKKLSCPDEDKGLYGDDGKDQGKDFQRSVDEELEIDGGPDGDKEQSEKQSLEGFDVAF